MERALPAANFLYWVGASTVAYLSLRALYSLFRAFQVWFVGNEAWVGPRLGEWAGEWSDSRDHGVALAPRPLALSEPALERGNFSRPPAHRRDLGDLTCSLVWAWSHSG